MHQTKFTNVNMVMSTACSKESFILPNYHIKPKSIDNQQRSRLKKKLKNRAMRYASNCFFFTLLTPRIALIVLISYEYLPYHNNNKKKKQQYEACSDYRKLVLTSILQKMIILIAFDLQTLNIKFTLKLLKDENVTSFFWSNFWKFSYLQ